MNAYTSRLEQNSVSNVFSAGTMFFDIMGYVKNQCYKVRMVNFKHIVLKPPNINPKQLPVLPPKQTNNG